MNRPRVRNGVYPLSCVVPHHYVNKDMYYYYTRTGLLNINESLIIPFMFIIFKVFRWISVDSYSPLQVYRFFVYFYKSWGNWYPSMLNFDVDL